MQLTTPPAPAPASTRNSLSWHNYSEDERMTRLHVYTQFTHLRSNLRPPVSILLKMEAEYFSKAMARTYERSHKTLNFRRGRMPHPTQTYLFFFPHYHHMHRQTIIYSRLVPSSWVRVLVSPSLTWSSYISSTVWNVFIHPLTSESVYR